MNISLPDSLKTFVDQQVAQGGYGSSSEYVRELIRTDQVRRAKDQLRELLREGLASGECEPLEDGYWSGLRQRISDARQP
ncbi:MAG: type II toxin-antitoxin system ParD family antitoxin [Rhodocyclaceae bacterium]|nr:type II toxin-antitoxin system ParD family antitoxin [Rhodocyclaceae bacterium]